MRRLTTKEFINKSIEIYGKKYNYSKTDYINARIDICIICPKHGEFLKTPSNHLRGQGCPKCSNENHSKSIIEPAKTEFVEKANIVHHNTYNYSKSNYITAKTDISIFCYIHGEFLQTPSSHLSGRGCPKCGRNKRSEIRLSKAKNEFEEKANRVHNSKYKYPDILKTYKGNKICIPIICPIHGEFFQKPTHHLSGKGCPICRASKGEEKIRNILIKNNLSFKEQKRYKDCRGKLPLPFDFKLKNGILIEYDGEQHFKPINHFGGEKGFKTRQLYDKIKTEYCKRKKLTLIRIPYTVTDNEIEKIILESSNTKEKL